MSEFTVYKSYELRSALDPDAIWSRIEPEVEPLVQGRITIPFAETKPYEGKRTPEGFVIKGLHHKSQYVTPMTHVRMEPSTEGTTLQVQVQRTGLSKPIVPLVSVIIAASVAGGALASDTLPLLGVALLLLCGGLANWGLANVRLASRFGQDRSYLESRIEPGPRE